MKLEKIWANMAVSDLARTTRFYTEIGFTPNGIADELTSFKVGDFIIHFFIKDKLATAFKGELADLDNGNEVLFTLGAESRDDVHRWAEAVRKAGGKLVSEPEEFGEGYYGFDFADPDGHRYNVFYM